MAKKPWFKRGKTYRCDKCLGMLEAVGDVFPEAKYQRCIVRFYPNVFSVVREIRRRTRVVGAFPDGNSALMLVCDRLRHVAGTQWGNKKYMNMKHLEMLLKTFSMPDDFIPSETANLFAHNS